MTKSNLIRLKSIHKIFFSLTCTQVQNGNSSIKKDHLGGDWNPEKDCC